ncbi:asparagine synthase (glutamine-hydrolyzing) [Xanthocytophaga agilis]|uniref:asparagine synthase (glutamine-hydrolyzing) n=1 Tax=Xanthocytophaga agilis TaxID=3048010 RepID=A0AAE3R534_9BACT|nr:asparagine synthase (glutamine-hydrolyzing) [Xanthocytophaga agilis]MDJ1503375.1 asparagine synthase (glutamine-hydrolyzing) [Xanthocytophaga agilis]
MCGITGFYSTQQAFSESDLRKMTGAIRHRGPNAEGHFLDEICGLGHRRLSILDLSEGANQPFYSNNDRFVIVYNGEVYNYKEVTNQYGITPQTTSDTEIILEAFVKDGIHCVNYFNGMFAFAVYDKHKKELWLCRDRLGIKPLFYYWDGSKLAFASELKALLTLPISKILNKPAIAEFLHRGFIPAPYTIYQNIYKLSPGSWLKISDNVLEEQKYWKITENIGKEIISDEHQAMERVEELLLSSVKYQLISDVPVGVFLSGGIDSSTVAALTARQLSHPINTFSIGFKESRHNEAPYAREVAEHLHTNHHEFIVSVQDAKDLVETMLDIYDEPYADSSAIPTMLVSQMASKYVGVVLTGEGGDELFHGYGMYQWADRLSQGWLKLLRKPLASLLAVGKEARYQKAAELLEYFSEDDISSHIFCKEQGYFSYPDLKKLVGEPWVNGKGFLSKSSLPPVVENRLLTASETQSLFDMVMYLPDDLLTKVDRASMQYGLEARVPLLDHRLVELALNISPELKNNGGTTKYILKQILYKYLPSELFNRPKQGFSIPLYDWLLTDLRYLIDTYLSDEVIERHGYVNKEIVSTMKKEFFAGKKYVYNRLWTLIILHRWLEKNT